MDCINLPFSPSRLPSHSHHAVSASSRDCPSLYLFSDLTFGHNLSIKLPSAAKPLTVLKTSYFSEARWHLARFVEQRVRAPAVGAAMWPTAAQSARGRTGRSTKWGAGVTRSPGRGRSTATTCWPRGSSDSFWHWVRCSWQVWCCSSCHWRMHAMSCLGKCKYSDSLEECELCVVKYSDEIVTPNKMKIERGCQAKPKKREAAVSWLC